MLRALALAAFLLAATTASAAEQTVWQIGKPDHSYAEFAIAGDYHAYEAKVGQKPVVFEVGKSEAARDWPFIQPGPADPWAGGREHPFTIRFALEAEPRGIFTLRIELVDVQKPMTPSYRVAVGGRTAEYRLEPGGGDGSLTDPHAGKPQKLELALPADLFKKGPNDIVLTTVGGSWVEYDAVTLLNDPDGKMPEAAVQTLTATATPFFIRHGDEIGRAIDVGVTLTAPASEIAIRAEAGGKTFDLPIKQLAALGSVTGEIAIPDSPEPQEVKITATVAGKSKSTTVQVLPQRKWRIYVAPSSHTDIGYTDLQPKCAETHNLNADKAVELAAKFPDFKWNMEVAWQAENYLATRKGEKLDAFLKLAKEGRIGVQALYCNILTGLCSTEEACRFTWFAHTLKEKYGIPYRSAMISDVPTQEATVPMILAAAGIRYFSSGVNNDRGYTFTQLYAKSPYWWEGPDGSRVLMTDVPGYAHAQGWGLDTTVEQARPRVIAALKGYEGRKDYPYDAVFLHGAVSDNCAMNPQLADVAKAWNERYEYPKVILSHNTEFYEYVEKQYGDKLPVVRGSGGTYWEDGAGSSAQETALVRNAHERITAAQTMLALARQLKPEIEYPAKEIQSAWRQCLLYDEHTWGAAGSIGAPDSDMTKAQWKIKAQYAVDADKEAKALADGAAKALAGLVKGRGLVVMNPTDAVRTDILEVKGGLLADRNNGCRLGERTIRVVREVPAHGLRVEAPADQPAAPAAEELQGTTIESRYYRITFDPATGGMTSLFDKELNRELLDTAAPYRANQYLYVSGGDGSRIVAGGPVEPKLTVNVPEKATLKRLKLGTLGERMIIETSAVQTPKLVSEVTVWNDLKRVDITNRLQKIATYKKEGVYFAFPLAGTKPTIRYEVPAGVVNANKDMLPGACYEWFTVQHFVEVETADVAVAWATPDAPLVCFQDIFRGRWQSPVEMKNGYLFAYVMNNYWHTNYKAGQDGDFLFRFALTSRAKSDPAASARFGAAVASPLMAVTAEAQAGGVLPANGAGLVEVAEPNVIAVSAKQADSGAGLVIRLWEAGGQATTAHVRLPQGNAKKATACNLVEEPQGELEVKDGAIAVPVKGHGLATVIVE